MAKNITLQQIKRAQELSEHVSNFNGCMKDCQEGFISTDRDGNVDGTSLLAWLVSNEWAISIAEQFKQELSK